MTEKRRQTKRTKAKTTKKSNRIRRIDRGAKLVVKHPPEGERFEKAITEAIQEALNDLLDEDSTFALLGLEHDPDPDSPLDIYVYLNGFSQNDHPKFAIDVRVIIMEAIESKFECWDDDREIAPFLEIPKALRKLADEAEARMQAIIKQAEEEAQS